MNKISFLVVWCYGCLLLPLCAQSGDWHEVRSIVPGSGIRVKEIGHRGARSCVLLRTSDTELRCESEHRSSKQYQFAKSEITEVAIVGGSHGHGLRGAAIGAVIGAVMVGALGADTSAPESLVYAPAAGALTGGLWGFAIGSAIHGRHVIVVYRAGNAP